MILSQIITRITIPPPPINFEKLAGNASRGFVSTLCNIEMGEWGDADPFACSYKGYCTLVTEVCICCMYSFIDQSSSVVLEKKGLSDLLPSVQDTRASMKDPGLKLCPHHVRLCTGIRSSKYTCLINVQLFTLIAKSLNKLYIGLFVARRA